MRSEISARELGSIDAPTGTEVFQKLLGEKKRKGRACCERWRGARGEGAPLPAAAAGVHTPAMQAMPAIRKRGYEKTVRRI
jgi:hypothetical protein